MTQPTTSSATAPAAPAGNLSGALDQLLKGFGVERSAERSTAEQTVAATLASRGHTATVAELRWGVLVLEASPAAARLLSFDRDLLMADLALAVPGSVQEIRIRTRRR